MCMIMMYGIVVYGKKCLQMTDRVLECDRSCEHFCPKCIDMSDVQYKTLQRLECFWYCPSCVENIILAGNRIEVVAHESNLPRAMDDLTITFQALEFER